MYLSNTLLRVKGDSFTNNGLSDDSGGLGGAVFLSFSPSSFIDTVFVANYIISESEMCTMAAGGAVFVEARQKALLDPTHLVDDDDDDDGKGDDDDYDDDVVQREWVSISYEASFLRCTFRHNHCQIISNPMAFALFFSHVYTTLTDCLFDGHWSQSQSNDHAVVLFAKSHATLLRCIFHNNSMGGGTGAVYSSLLSWTCLDACVFTRNVGPNGGAIWYGIGNTDSQLLSAVAPHAGSGSLVRHLPCKCAGLGGWYVLGSSLSETFQMLFRTYDRRARRSMFVAASQVRCVFLIWW